MARGRHVSSASISSAGQVGLLSPLDRSPSGVAELPLSDLGCGFTIRETFS
jgi:hypothetical protein